MCAIIVKEVILVLHTEQTARISEEESGRQIMAVKRRGPCICRVLATKRCNGDT